MGVSATRLNGSTGLMGTFPKNGMRLPGERELGDKNFFTITGDTMGLGSPRVTGLHAFSGLILWLLDLDDVISGLLCWSRLNDGFLIAVCEPGDANS